MKKPHPKFQFNISTGDPRSLAPFSIVTYNVKWIKTFLTYITEKS